MCFYIEHEQKAKTINNGSFLKLFKTVTARVLSRIILSGYALEFLNEKNETLLFVFLTLLKEMKKDVTKHILSRASIDAFIE